MEKVDQGSFRNEAEECRRKALAYRGRPEAEFLTRVAKAFEALAETARAPAAGADPSRGC